MELAPPLIINPLNPNAHSHTIIFLHGRGDNAVNFHRAISYSPTHTSTSLLTAFPTTRFVFPQAPIRPLAAEPSAKWTQWFDVWSTKDFNAREDITIAGLKEVVPPLTKLIAQEAERLGGRWDHVVLMGISMGGATGAHLLMNLEIPDEGRIGEKRLGAWVAFSARCPLVGRDLAGMRAALGVWNGKQGKEAESEVLKNTPILIEHCVDDPLVQVDVGRILRDTLRSFGATVEWKEYPKGGHWFKVPEGMDHAANFLKQHVEGLGALGGQPATPGDTMELS